MNRVREKQLGDAYLGDRAGCLRQRRAVPPAQGRVGGTVRAVIRYCFTDAAAAVTTLATSRECETLAACDASSSVTCAPARLAM